MLLLDVPLTGLLNLCMSMYFFTDSLNLGSLLISACIAPVLLLYLPRYLILLSSITEGCMSKFCVVFTWTVAIENKTFENRYLNFLNV